MSSAAVVISALRVKAEYRGICKLFGENIAANVNLTHQISSILGLFHSKKYYHDYICFKSTQVCDRVIVNIDLGLT